MLYKFSNLYIIYICQINLNTSYSFTLNSYEPARKSTGFSTLGISNELVEFPKFDAFFEV